MRIRKKPKKLTPEGIITKAIRNFLKFCGVFHWKVFQTLGSTPGVSDVIAIRTYSLDELCGEWKRRGLTKVGVFVAIEIKDKNKNPTEDQKNFLFNVEQSGGIGIVARSVDDVIDALGFRKKLG